MTRFARILGYLAASMLINALFFAVGALAMDMPVLAWIAGAASALLALVILVDISRALAEARAARREQP